MENTHPYVGYAVNSTNTTVSLRSCREKGTAYAQSYMHQRIGTSRSQVRRTWRVSNGLIIHVRLKFKPPVGTNVVFESTEPYIRLSAGGSRVWCLHCCRSRGSSLPKQQNGSACSLVTSEALRGTWGRPLSVPCLVSAQGSWNF